MTSLIDGREEVGVVKVSEALCDVVYGAMMRWEGAGEKEKAAGLCKVLKEYITKCANT
eukprot:CAMPEP_0182471070 /NCGR_PEP_ID=MMETSP1319-20130603/19704_1 /TAXON_ID=172717 /ORGANISM="Bolidomonas pacifica, Strain RCC208" /LENGTH=57 /DNA_ID=CAMNT_0024671585 /DNA_START=730 /DNA_END=900 /DNA_ORIENTATION=+